MQVEANLQSPRETLQIPYPRNFNTNDKTHTEDREIIAGYEPRYYTEAELAVVDAYLPGLPYAQALIRTGAIAIGNDVLLGTATADDLDRIEASAGFANSRYLDEKYERSLRERVLIVRESGYRGGVIAAPTKPAATPVTTVPATATKVAGTVVVTTVKTKSEEAPAA